MASISTQVNVVDRMSAPLYNIIGSIQQVTSALQNVDVATSQGFDISAIDNARRSVDLANAQMEEIEANIRQAAQQQQNLNNQVNQGSNAMGGFAQKALRAAAAFASFYTVGKILNLSDQISMTDARLNLLNNNLQVTQDQIFGVAQRSRGEFLATGDVIAKLGQRAGDAFDSGGELLQFAENLNKQFVIAGASQMEMQSASLQLTQALGSGVLRGEELNAVFEAAPNVIQTIADYLGVPLGAIRDMASEGQITADIIKNAMLSATDNINAQFETIPMTFSQAWTGIQNDLLMTFQPVLNGLAQGATWIHDNWSIIEPIFWGLTAAVGAYALITGIQTAATWLSVAANQALIVTMLSNPILWIAVLIGVLIAKLYQWVQSVGGVEVAWKIAMNGIKTGWDWTCIGIMTGVYWVMNKFNEFQLMFMTVSTNVQNFMGDMKAGTLMILQNMVNGAIDIINDFINIINKIPGVSIDAIAQVSFGTTAELENQANKAARNANLNDYANDVASKISARESALNQMKLDALNATAERQAEIDTLQANAAADKDASLLDTFGSMASNLDTIAGSTGDIADSVAISEENLKYLFDKAEEDTINRFTTAEIKIDMGGITQNISNDVDVDGVINKLTTAINESVAACAEGVHQ